MRVLTFTSLFPNSASPTSGIFIHHRMRCVSRRPGTHVEVVAPIPYAPPFGPAHWTSTRSVPATEVSGGLTVHHPRYLLLPKISMPLHGMLMFLGSYRTVRSLHARNSFDCIDAHYIYPDGFAAILLGKLLKLPVILSARGSDMTLFPSFRTIRPMIRYALRNAAGVIGVSSALRDAMIANGASRDRAFTVGNGVDLQLFHPVPSEDARKQLGLPSQAQIIVSIGTLVPHKGHERTIRAVASLRDALPQLRSYIVGEGADRARLARLAKDLGIENEVTFVGRQPQDVLKLWFSAADVSCLSSSREGWPNVILESLACGTPVVATRVWGIPEVLSSPEVGVLVDESSEAVTAGLREALGRRWDRAAIVRFAAARPWEKVAEEVEEVFRLCYGSEISAETEPVGSI